MLAKQLAVDLRVVDQPNIVASFELEADTRLKILGKDKGLITQKTLDGECPGQLDRFSTDRVPR